MGGSPSFMDKFGGPLIGGIGSLAGAGISSIGGKKAAQAQERAQREALAFAKQQEAARGQRYGQALEGYRNQWNAWNANRNALLSRYGVDIAQPMMAAPAAQAGAPVMMRPGMGANGRQPANLADMLRADMLREG